MLDMIPNRVDGSAPLSAPEAILRRRATRHFDPNRCVPEETLAAILELATHAPSGYNLQPWRFVVVQEQRNRARLRTCAYGQRKVAEAPVVVIVLGYQNPHLTDLDVIVEDQVRRGVVTSDEGAGIRGAAKQAMTRVADIELWTTRSTMLAAATLMIASESLGLSSAPMEGFEAEKVRQAFGIPDDHTICCLIALGFATSEKPAPGRLGLDHVCYSEHFGQPWNRTADRQASDS